MNHLSLIAQESTSEFWHWVLHDIHFEFSNSSTAYQWILSLSLLEVMVVYYEEQVIDMLIVWIEVELEVVANE